MTVVRGLHLHFDPQSGIAGDMAVAALVDVGVPRKVIADAVAAMRVPGLRVAFERRRRGSFVGTGFVVRWPGMRRTPSARATKAAGHTHFTHGASHGHAHDRPSGRPGRRRGPEHGHHHDDHDHDHEHVHPHEHHDGSGVHEHRHRNGGHEHRDYEEIRRLLRRSQLDGSTKALASRIFDRIAEVEAKLHGVPVARVSFHEVGAFDSIADIVGAAAALSWLEPSAVTSSPPVVGTGHAHTAHGVVPVPAPATAKLLQGVPIHSEGTGELTTPTGAAILAVVTQSFGPPPPMLLVAQGFGAGTRELADRANVLRVLMGKPVGHALPPAPAETIVLQANIDDMNPQLVEPLMTALFAAGAVDVWVTPILMKKGRPAVEISALVPPAAHAAAQRAFFEHSTTLGVRATPAARAVLGRSQARVATPFGPVTVKVAALDGHIMGATPEFEDCRRLAAKAGVPVRQVVAAASVAALRLQPRRSGR